MNWGRNVWLCAWVLAMFVACGGTKTKPPDLVAADDFADIRPDESTVIGDTAPLRVDADTETIELDSADGDSFEWSPPPPLEAQLGKPCPGDGDCIDRSGWLMCLKVADFPPFCATSNCVQQGECPEGWGCWLDPTTDPSDPKYICLPTPHELCEPCTMDSECLDTLGRCVEMNEGGGSFCTAACGDDGACPEGYVCQYVTGVDPQPVAQCVPLSGNCQCVHGTCDDGNIDSCIAEHFDPCQDIWYCEEGCCVLHAYGGFECCDTDEDCELCTDVETLGSCPCEQAGAGSCVKNLCVSAKCVEYACYYEDKVGQGDCDDGEECTVESCDPATGECIHTPLADETPCGEGASHACAAGQCQCIPQCEGKECGADGCGGLCGTCDFFQTCEDWHCTPPPPQDCEGKECGDDGYGGNCGECADGCECSPSGICVCG